MALSSLKNFRELDPAILYSAVNMLLRDEYGSLEELCLAQELDSRELRAKLSRAGFEYDEQARRFR